MLIFCLVLFSITICSKMNIRVHFRAICEHLNALASHHHPHPLLERMVECLCPPPMSTTRLGLFLIKLVYFVIYWYIINV